MKKNKSLSNFEMHNSSVSSKNAIHKRTKDAEAIYAETSEKIKRGLEKATASTGTPIASLKGGAKYMAQLSNVGGGSVKIGGGGIKEGFNTFCKKSHGQRCFGQQKLIIVYQYERFGPKSFKKTPIQMKFCSITASLI